MAASRRLAGGVGALGLSGLTAPGFCFRSAPHDGDDRACSQDPAKAGFNAAECISALLMVGTIYIVVWNANYLAFGRPISAARCLDTGAGPMAYARCSPPIVYDGWFPLTHSPWLIVTLERGVPRSSLKSPSLFLLVPYATAPHLRGALSPLLRARL